MAFGDAYATVAQLETRLGTSDDGSFARILDAASRTVEHFTRRQFNRDDDEYGESRRYRALDPERVAVDDFHTLDGLAVEVNGTLWDPANIDARPWNAGVVLHGYIDWPYELPFSDLFAINRRFPWSRRGLITVTAQWGWSAVPSGITEATLDVAEVMTLAVTSGGGTISSERMGDYSVSFAAPLSDATSADVPRELRKAVPFRRKVFGVA